MMIVLLLLGAFVSIGFSYDIHEEEVYGSSYHIVLLRKVALFEFIPKHSTNVTVLWKEGDRKFSSSRNFLMTSNYFSLSKVTQKNSGRYIMRDKDGKELFTHILNVKATTKTYERKPGERLSLSFNLDSNSCNIYFFPERVHQPRVLKHKIVHQGKLQDGTDELDCDGFVLTRSCGISNNDLQMSCRGRYEIRDENDNTALSVSLQMERITKTLERKPGESFEFSFQLEPKSCNIYFFPENDYQTGDKSTDIVRQGKLQRDLDESCTGFTYIYPCGILNEVLQMECNGRYEIQDQNGDTAKEVSLEMEALDYEPSGVGIGVGVVLASLFCYCVKCFCCSKSSSKEDRSETAAAEPDVNYQEYDHEPVGPRPDQLRQPAQPSYMPTVPMIHDHPTVNMPPAYSEIYDPPTFNMPPAYSEVSAPAEPADAPTVPVHSDPEPQFELRGMTFPSAPPLTSDSAYSAVYTSDKHNFL